MGFEQAIGEALANCEAALARAEQQQQEVSIRIQRLTLEKRGLMLALDRHRRVAKSMVTNTVVGSMVAKKTMAQMQMHAAANGWRGMARPDAVVRLLRDVGHPLTSRELAAGLAHRGRHDEPKFVSAALSALKARGAVVPTGDGRWWLAGGEATQESDSDDRVTVRVLSEGTSKEPEAPGSGPGEGD